MASNPSISNYSKIIDISQPVGSKSACFPGDTPFSRNVTLTVEQTGCFNLTSLTMSPHVGTHADSPVHIKGDMEDLSDGMASHLPLESYLGPVRVIDLTPLHSGITAKHFLDKVASIDELPPRI